ncbi:g255 [Coccomyxa viridis]|uniref:G255 protein n=1 Tax=Coccomyxa viridis TaxID=1274662 RepID=A0ABP1FH96_9CHLO
MEHQPQQGAPAAKPVASASPAAESGSHQEQTGSSGSKRFTPAQQAVATALLVVTDRALKNGKEAMFAARLIMVANSLDTLPLLEMLPQQRPLPTVKQLQQRASDVLLDSLTKLTSQCAAAQCQPLEVFTRSMQCTAHWTAPSHTRKVWLDVIDVTLLPCVDT